MSGFRRIRRGFAASTIVLAAFVTGAAAEPRPFGALGSPDPAETAAPADAGLTAACQASLRERFGQQPLGFTRPSHTAHDGTRIVRMDVTLAGQTLRATCSRDGAGGPVEAAVFDAAADDAGPRVIVLGGQPSTAPAAAPDRGYRFVARDPNASTFDPALAYPGYGGSWLPGLWVPELNGRGSGSHFFVKRGSSGIETVRGETTRIGSIPRGSSAPFASGGIASPAISNFPANAARPGGGFRGGVGVRSGGVGGIGR
jgi:hypothetical protein